MTAALNGNLTCTASDHILVALLATLRVVRRSDAVLLGLNLFKDEPGIIIGPRWLHVVFVDLVKVGPLTRETVGEVVKTRDGCAIDSGSFDEARRPLGRGFPLRNETHKSMIFFEC